MSAATAAAAAAASAAVTVRPGAADRLESTAESSKVRTDEAA
jgi:hypothetical protein